MMLQVHRGKGAKDRMVPLPHSTLATLREHWQAPLLSGGTSLPLHHRP